MKMRLFPWVVGLGLILLLGRYDWSTDAFPYSLRSYVASAYYFALFFPLLNYLLSRFSGPDRRKDWAVALMALIYCLPDRWLGLSRFRLAYDNYADWRSPQFPSPQLDWFPRAFRWPMDIPFQKRFFGILFLAGIVILLLRFRRSVSRKSCWIAIGLLSIILIETFLHLSLHSPYTYIPHYEFPMQNRYWYHDYLFPGTAQGAVNLDYPIFRAAEGLFTGVPQSLNALLARTFPMYLSSLFSLYLNPYYVWIALNLTLWSLGIWMIYRLSRSLFGERVALYASILMAMSQGMILYVAQPMIYAFAIAGLALILELQRMLFEKDTEKVASALAFGVSLGLFLLCYDAQPWLVAIPIVALIRGWNTRWTLASIAIGLVVYEGFQLVCAYLPQLATTSSTYALGDNPIQHLIGILQTHDFQRLFQILILELNGFPDSMFRAFPLLLLPAAVGLGTLRGKQAGYLLALVLPAFLAYSFMQFGETIYIEFPRLVYSAYPAIFIASAAFLVKLEEQWLKPRSAPWLGQAVTWSFLALNLIYVNLDAFGFPQIYYRWFYRTRAFFGP